MDDGRGGGVIGRYAQEREIRARGDGLYTGEREDTLIDLINFIEAIGTEIFADIVVRNKARLLGSWGVLVSGPRPFRSQVCLELAQKLLLIAPCSNTLQGLQSWALEVDLDG